MSKGLVIVESPAKAKTIQKYLGKGYTVEASLGHVKDLPKSNLGVDIENDFDTEYIVIPGKEKVVTKLKKLAISADKIYLAPDPDREGEAIAAHLAEELGNGSNKKKKKKKDKDDEEGELAPHEKKIFALLKADEATHIDEIVERLETQVSSSEIFAALFELELAGKVKQLPGKNFVKTF